MPQIEQEVPRNLKPYQFHGVNIDHEEGREQAIGECPFCGKDKKFYVSLETSKFDCKSCGVSGNSTTFLRQWWKQCDNATEDYSELSADRGLLYPETLMYWGVCKSLISGEWLVPAYSADGKLHNLYRYVGIKRNGIWKKDLLPTPGVWKDGDVHGIFGLNRWNKNAKEVHVCEGVWDGLAYWEVMRNTKVNDSNEYEMTGGEQSSLLVNINVIAVPGCNVFQQGWAELLAGKRVVLLYDNDHSRENKLTKQPIAPVGYSSMKRVAGMLAVADEIPESISYLHWGESETDQYSTELPDGWDVRDALCDGDGLGIGLDARVQQLAELHSSFQMIPNEWRLGKKTSSVNGSAHIDCIDCLSWVALQRSWKKSMKWTEGLDRALSIMLACIVSTKSSGSQLWCKVIGPPSCGKSTLCEAISVNKKHVIAKSTMRGFHSGYDDGSGNNHSPLEKMKDKTLVIKDGDALMRAPNIAQILSEMRDVYDRVSRSSYRTKASKDWEGINLTVILCGTGGLKELDASELGERYLEVKIMDSIDPDMEDDILNRVAHAAIRAVGIRANGTMASGMSPERLESYQLTGGYINYLCDNADELIPMIDFPEENIEVCKKLAKYVAYMRARPSKKQQETVERELGSRLLEQFIRLAICLAVVLQRKSIDDEVMRMVYKTALDTARGKTQQIASYLFQEGEEGMTADGIGIVVGESAQATVPLLRFLKKIGVVERFMPEGVIRGKWLYRLTGRLQELYQGVINAVDRIVE